MKSNLNEMYVKLMSWLKPDSSVKTLIETGSHRGDGAATWATFFDTVYSIELSDELFEHCINTHKVENLTFIKGASTEVLTNLVSKVIEPYILFLDAHGSGGDTTFHSKVGRYGSPVLAEIECVRANPPQFILIDDLSDFDSISTYPNRLDITTKVNQIAEYEYQVFEHNKGMLCYNLVRLFE